MESGREFGKALHVCIVTLDAYAAIMARQGVSPLYSRAEYMDFGMPGFSVHGQRNCRALICNISNARVGRIVLPISLVG